MLQWAIVEVGSFTLALFMDTVVNVHVKNTWVLLTI